MNLDDTVAVTHNYVNEVNFDKVWEEDAKGSIGRVSLVAQSSRNEIPSSRRSSKSAGQGGWF